ncbi:MAG: hypothetical protein MZV70_65760 [Desulfobacterales bacterium]|nr:hypothetical protein [Desulfobacterales bacterium]
MYEKGIPHYELPVVFFACQVGRAAGGNHHRPEAEPLPCEADITFHYGLSPEIYYVPVTVVRLVLLYGKAYGYYKKKPKKQWKQSSSPTMTSSTSSTCDSFRLPSRSSRRGDQVPFKGRDFVAVHDDFHRKKQGKGRASDDRGKGHVLHGNKGRRET